RLLVQGSNQYSRPGPRPRPVGEGRPAREVMSGRRPARAPAALSDRATLSVILPRGPAAPQGSSHAPYPLPDPRGAVGLPPRRPAGGRPGGAGRAPGTMSPVPGGRPAARRAV